MKLYQYQILTFLQALIDTTSLLLLPHTPSHPLLFNLSRIIQPHLQVIDQGEGVRGYLEPFSRKAREKVKEKEEGGVKVKESDWRKRRKEKREAMEGVVGLYRLEELIL